MESAGANRELLENVQITEVSPQYMIQRMSVDAPQLLNAELIQSHPSLVDLAAGDYMPVNYAPDDLLSSQDLTEEDRNLAAALVAVQLSQQQKQQQLQQDSNIIINNGPLPSIPHLGKQTPKQTINLQSIISKCLADNKVALKLINRLSPIPILLEGAEPLYHATGSKQDPGLTKIIDTRFITRDGEIVYNGNIKGDFKFSINKSDEDTLEEGDLKIGRRDSDGDIRFDLKIAKKSLPHKKRISRKLKKNCNATARKTQHKCTFCELVFSAQEELNSHMSCHTAALPAQSTVVFCCQLCASTHHDQLEFFEHLKQHYEPLTSSSVLQPSHQTSEKQSIKSEDCNRDSLLNSLLTLSCLECGKTFKRQKAYEAHLRDTHLNKVEDFSEFSENEDIMEGIRNVVQHQVQHTDDDDDDIDATGAPHRDHKVWYREEELHATEADLRELEAQDHVCHLCKLQFPLRSMLLDHLVDCRNQNLSVKGESELTEDCKKRGGGGVVVVGGGGVGFKKKNGHLNCPHCDRVFSHRNSLVYHLRSHSGERPHQCDICGKSFFAASALKVHMRVHSGDKPYKCEHCGRHFRQWGDLKYHHISIHSDQKHYQCEYCGKDFARKYSLILHRRIHTGEKNYKCDFCGKTFRASTYLQNHRRIHTGEKPYPCEVCGKPFRVRSDMKRHLNTHARKRRSVNLSLHNDIIVELDDENNENNDSMLADGDDMKQEDEQLQQQQQLEAVAAATTHSSESPESTTSSVVHQATVHYTRESLDTVRDGSTVYSHGHQLFIYCPSESTPIQAMEQTWIQTENS